jgi:hypothetical protein
MPKYSNGQIHCAAELRLGWIFSTYISPSFLLLRLRADQQGGGTPVSVQNIDLYLPSSLVGKYIIQKEFLVTEWRLRFTHAEEALNDLRSLLVMQSMMWNSKGRHMRGQRQQTRSQTLLEGVKEGFVLQQISTEGYVKR